MRVGLFGGFFNPPHIGHIQAARSAAEKLELQRVLFIPSCVPPHKDVPPGTPSPEIRMRMAGIAASEVPGGEVCDVEIKRGGVSYTCDTVEQLRRELPGDDMWLIVGSDMLLSIQDWENAREIFKTCAIAALARNTADFGNIYAHADVLKSRFGARIDIIPHEPVEISSSELRRRLREGDGSYVTAGVYKYIAENRLYEFMEAK
ncbi:putative nicotinate-nucleotide adenylyltransferase [Clostridia bacterium]|nr:putative nicotinate-nucleotide adenylyltransferase [Clostridia bacterium]